MWTLFICILLRDCCNYVGIFWKVENLLHISSFFGQMDYGPVGKRVPESVRLGFKQPETSARGPSWNTWCPGCVLSLRRLVEYLVKMCFRKKRKNSKSNKLALRDQGCQTFNVYVLPSIERERSAEELHWFFNKCTNFLGSYVMLRYGRKMA